MQWSHLNEQMIEQFFQNSNSPSNAEISLNFTRTSRQMGSNQKPNKEISPRLQISTNSHEQKPINPESDILAFADKQLSKFDSWITQFNNDHQKHSHRLDSQWQAIQRELFKHESQSRPPKQSSLQNILLSKVDQVSKKITSLSYPKPCQHCALSEKKIFELQTQLKQLETNLQAKTIELARITEKEIKEIGYELSFEVQNRLLNVRVDELMNKNVQLSQTIQAKNHQLNKLSQEINKLHFEKSNFLSKTKALQTRAQQLQKSKSFLMSAAKNSTSHSQFNITNQALMTKSQNHTNIDTTLIHTNQFSAQKPSADDYCMWFQKLKQVYLQKYKKQQKEHLKKFPQLRNNQNELRKEISSFKKGSARYEVARSWNTIASYVSKNKQNFLQLINNEMGLGVRVPGFEGGSGNNGTNSNVSMNSNKENIKMVEYLEEEVKKSQKKAEGHLLEIENLNQQLMNMKKTLLKQKQQKTRLSRQVDELQEQLQQIQHQLQCTKQQLYSHQVNIEKSITLTKPANNPHFKHSSLQQKQQPCIQLVQQLQQSLEQLQKQLQLKSQQFNKLVYQMKSQQQSHLKLSQSIKQLQRLLHKQRLQKIHYFKNTLPQPSLTTACRIRPKSITQKKLPSLLHQIDSRIYVQKDNLSYKFDLCEQVGKKSGEQIYRMTKKFMTNCLYDATCSLVLSMGSGDSEYNDYFRGENGLVWSSISQIYKLKYSQKRFVQVDLSFSVIEITNTNILDLLAPADDQKPNKSSYTKLSDQLSLQNLTKLHFQTQPQAKSALNLTYSKQHQPNSHLITLIEFTITDKKNKHKFTSKLFFSQICLEHFSSHQEKSTRQNLLKDTQALWSVLKNKNFMEPVQTDSNRLTCLLSECFQQNSKNLLIINLSPTELHKQQSLYSLNYASSLKHIPTQKPHQSLIRYTEKTPQQSVSKLKHNSSHSLIQTPTLNPDSFQDKTRSITKHRNSSSQHTIYGVENGERKKRTISRLSIC